MSGARDVIAESIRTGMAMGWNARTISLRLENDLEAAGYRILGPDEVDPVTLEHAELACFHQQSKIHDRKRTEWDRGNDSAVNGCIHAIRAIGRKA